MAPRPPSPVAVAGEIGMKLGEIVNLGICRVFYVRTEREGRRGNREWKWGVGWGGVGLGGLLYKIDFYYVLIFKIRAFWSF
jgi:hypothetical protein